MALADTFHKTGRLNDAIKAYEYALKRMPGSSVIKSKLDLIKSEREEDKNITKSKEGLKSN
jgi:hypothetical protein